jgi:MscS family membrane protein
MNWRFQWLYRCLLALLLVGALGTLWVSAQESTNNQDRRLSPTNSATVTAVQNSVTNQVPGKPPKEPKRFDIQVMTFGLDEVDWLRDNKLMGEPLWKYLSSLIFIVLAFYVSKLLDYVVNVWLKKLAARTATKYDDLLLELLHGPVKVIAFIIFLHIGLGVFDWPGRAQLILSRGLIIVVASSVTYVLLKLVDLLLGIWREKTTAQEDKTFAEQLFPLVRKAAKVVIVIAAILFTADNLEINIKTLLAGLSVGGLALGLAAQDTVANLFGAVSIFLDRPFHIGDRIRVEGVDGMVEAIGLRSTCIRSLEGHHVIIPNKLMGNAIITNITRRPTIKTEINLGLTYDTPAEKVQRATVLLEEIFKANPKTVDLIISFNKFADSSMNILVVHTWNGTDAKVHFAELQALNLEIKRRFDMEKIEFAYPTQTVYVKHEPVK